jgi:prepilin-type N-terminal cleavage/methylation domain-containing protein
MRQKRLAHGYTLLEVLTVVAIIGILVTLSFGPIRAAQIRNRDFQRKSDLNLIAQGLDTYYSDRRTYPSAELCDGTGQPDTSTQNPTNWIEGLAPYLPSTQGKTNRIPIDPKNTTAYHYVYCLEDDGYGYRLTATLENGRDPEGSGVPPKYTIKR